MERPGSLQLNLHYILVTLSLCALADGYLPGSWVRMAPFPKLGIIGGIPLRDYSQDKSWDTDDEGFAVSMHHQIHCLVHLGPRENIFNRSLTVFQF